jgi:hypothetical protein
MLSLLLTLVVTPVVYSLFEDLAGALGRTTRFVRRRPSLGLWRSAGIDVNGAPATGNGHDDADTSLPESRDKAPGFERR